MVEQILKNFKKSMRRQLLNQRKKLVKEKKRLKKNLIMVKFLKPSLKPC
jgi:hypothetical protein